jgi:C4-dicarboxylate-specific signal transduction histidine kinase
LVKANEADWIHWTQNDPRGQQVPRYLNLLAQQWHEEHELMTRETDALGQRVEQIKDIISRQQALGAQIGVRETLDIPRVMADILALHAPALQRTQVEVIVHHEGPNTWEGERSPLSQIVLNLVKNAQESLAVVHGRPRRLWLNSVCDVVGGLVVRVRDNGGGIHPDVMSKLFTYGYSTKPNGHGFGLHASAVAAQDLGGRLTVASNAPADADQPALRRAMAGILPGGDLGVTFTLHLPGREV